MNDTGAQISQLKYFTAQLELFPQSHPLSERLSDEYFREQLLTWHQDLLQLQNSIHEDFDVVWSRTTLSSNAILVLYTVSFITNSQWMTKNLLPL